MKSKVKKNGAVIYQTKSGAIELRGDFSHETVWATQAQIATLFDIERSVITKHTKNIFKDNELEEKSVCAKFAHTAEDGKTYIVKFYNLDMIISVGYRINSKNATKFRQWANKVLKQYLVRGYAINRKRIEKNYEAFLKVVEDIKQLVPNNTSVDASMALDLVKSFALTWVSLDAYDKERLPKKGATKREVTSTAEKFVTAYNKLRFNWEKEAGAGLFGVEWARGV